tara:strand:- start:750 stop:1892 length:1143 start_codon:yes stop_codon:yes gene_type:complete
MLLRPSFFSLLLFIHIYAYSAWVGQGTLSSASLYITLFLSIITFQNNTRLSINYLLLFIFFSMILLSFSFGISGGAYAFMQLLASSLIFFAVLTSFKANRGLLKLVCFFCVGNIFILFSFWVGTGMVLFKPWVFINLNPNVLGFFSFLNLFFIIILFTYERNYITSIFLVFTTSLALMLIVVSGARTAFVASILAVLIYFVIRSINIKYKGYFLIIACIFCFIPFLAYGYVFLSESIYSEGLNQLVWEQTGKSLFTGRNDIWAIIFDEVGRNFFFGSGLGASLEQIGINISSHNLYLMIIFQVGLVGYLIFMCWLIVMPKVLVPYLGPYNDPIAILSISWVLATLMHQGFEIFLFQNNLAASFLFWFVFAIPFTQKNILS